MKKTLLPLLAVAFLSLSCNPGDGWIRLFNGKNLDGWTVKFTGYPVNENFKDTFRVEDGLLKVSYDQYDAFNGEFGHIFYKDTFSHYLIRLEYRFTGEQPPGGPEWALYNNGIMVHSQSPESMEIDQEFPVSIEAQILGDDGSSTRTSGNVCTPGTNIVMNGELVTQHCTVTSNKAFPPGEWVTMEVEVRGNTAIKHILNGEVVSSYTQPQLDERDPYGRKMLEGGHDKMLSEGYIALQAESHPVEFRNIELRVLDPDAGEAAP